MKSAVLKAYELAIGRSLETVRSDAQTYVEFARTKETLFDRWCTSKEVQKDFGRLRQLVLMEEFKNCLPSEIKTHLDEQNIDSLHQAAVRANDYALTHKSFGKAPLCSKDPVESGNTSNDNSSSRSSNPANAGKTISRGGHFPQDPHAIIAGGEIM